MNLSRIFIERPVMTALISFAILLFGAIAFRELPVAARFVGGVVEVPADATLVLARGEDQRLTFHTEARSD